MMLPTVLPCVGCVLVLALAFGPHSQLEWNRGLLQAGQQGVLLCWGRTGRGGKFVLPLPAKIPVPGLRWAVHKHNHLWS